MTQGSETQIIIRYADKEILLLGTAHVSKESVEEAAAVVRTEKPDLVCVELDQTRYTALMQKDSWQNLDITKVIRQGKGFLLLANLVLSGFQRRLGNDLGVKPGDEMKQAVLAACELGLPYRFCDRELQVTLRRAWESCSLWSKCKLFAALLSSAFFDEKLSAEDVEKLKNKSELDGVMAELAGYLPSVKKTLIDERDHYLAAKIYEAAGGENIRRVAAIVGAGHLSGIAARLEDLGRQEAPPLLTDVAALEQIPPPGFFARALTWLVPLVIAALIVSGFVFSGVQTGVENLLRWLLWNGSLAALGALAALAHPLAILVSFIGAPIGTISPVLSIGVFSGITQAALRRPRVADAETLSADVASMAGIYKNRITRALLVFFLSSLGGAIGNLISIPTLVKSFF
ncbi:MAG: TraB/GumN family protein [Spirochaetaceae bacterium]|jgi:pheromone shutdown-related protein TraB|nr:TraB/GumN family protein [Spirochaetaceae bacterium]